MSRSEAKAETRDAILASAATLLRERGITASSVADVMKGAGLTVGGFYGHFATKEALFTTAIRATARTKWDAMIASAKGTASARLYGVVKTYVSRAHRDRPADGCLLPETVPEATKAEGLAYRAPLAEEIDGFARSLTELSGSREVTLGLIALMYGALALSRGLAGTALSDEILVAARGLAQRLA